MRSMVKGVYAASTSARGPAADPPRPVLNCDCSFNPLHHAFGAVPLPLRVRIPGDRYSPPANRSGLPICTPFARRMP
jgi:hypothetical protein